MMTFKQQAATFLTEIQSRRRNPVRQATISRYQSYLDKWILPEFGGRDLSQIENGAVKGLVARLVKAGLAAATVTGIVSVVKQVVASAVDESGNEMYPRKWNHDFIDLPIIKPAEQDAPTIAAAAIQRAVGRAKGSDKALYALLAGSGLRMGEALALMVGPDDGKNSFWQPETATLTIRTTLTGEGIQLAPKTEAGVREVDLAPELNTFLSTMLLDNELPGSGLLFRSAAGTPARPGTAYKHLQRAGVTEGFHAFRRFRCTHLEKVGVPRGLAMFWTGHAGQDVHDRYIRIGADIEARKEWARKAGLGFQLEAR